MNGIAVSDPGLRVPIPEKARAHYLVNGKVSYCFEPIPDIPHKGVAEIFLVGENPDQCPYVKGYHVPGITFMAG